MRYYYRIWKLLITSSIALELFESRQSTQDDVTYNLFYNPKNCQNLSSQSITRSYDEGNLLVTIDYQNRVIILIGEATAHAISLIIISDIVADILIKEWNYPILHASAVCKDDEAIAFTGSSNSGKSTLASFFAIKGYRILTDDIFPMMNCNDESYTFPLQSGIKLRKESVQEMNKIAKQELYKVDEKCHVFDSPATKSIRISAVYVLSSSNDLIVNEIEGIRKTLFLIKNLHHCTDESILKKVTQSLPIKFKMYSLQFPKNYDMCEEIYKIINDGEKG